MKCVVLFSGGMDSAVLLHWMREKGYEVAALAFDYGQRHRIELEYASKYATANHFPIEVANVSAIASLIAGKSCQMNRDVAVPHGSFTDESMKATVIPNRNMIMLSIAVGHAIASGASVVAFAAHSGDRTIYPDCRREFVESLDSAVGKCDWQHVSLYAPFLEMHKGAVAAQGYRLGVNFAATWSCYEGGPQPCGQCGACNERQEALWYVSRRGEI